MAKTKGGGILARTARTAKGLAKRAAGRARRGVKAAGTPNQEIPPPTDEPSVQRIRKKAKGPARRVTPSIEGAPVHASGSKGAARKAPGGPPRGGKR